MTFERARSPALAYTAAVVCLAAFLVPAALIQSAEGDEGFYSLSAALVADGRMPYQDFAYLQTPLLPFVYGGWTLAIGESWFGIRALTCILAIALGLLLFHHTSTRFRSWGAGFLAVALFASSSLVFQWFTLAKTYALSSLLLFGAYCIVAGTDRPEAEAAPGRGRWFAAGGLLGLAVDVRLIFIVALPVLLVYALGRLRKPRSFRAAAGPLLAGTLAGALPTIVFLALDPARFVYLTFEYHRLRGHTGFWDSVEQKLQILGGVLGEDSQFLVLAALTLVLVVAVAHLRRRLPLAVGLAGALAVASLVPTPAYDQYFVTVVPFLVVAAVELAFVIGSLTSDVRARALLRRAALAATLLFVLVGAIQAWRLLFPDFRPTAERLSTVSAVASAIDAHTRPGEVVLANWPGYLYESDAEQLPGVENDFAPSVAAAGDLSERKSAEYHLLTYDGIERAIRAGRPRLVVVRPAVPLAPLDLKPWPPILQATGYEVVEDVKGVLLYARPERIRARLSTRGGRDLIVPERGPELPVTRGAVQGFVEGVASEDGETIVSGWALDKAATRPAERVIVFSGRASVGSSQPALPRPDIAQAHGAAAERSGFRLTVPSSEPIRVFAVAGGRASELPRLR